MWAHRGEVSRLSTTLCLGSSSISPSLSPDGEKRNSLPQIPTL